MGKGEDFPVGPSPFFGAQEVKLSYTGDIIGDARLVLLTDEVIPISGGKAVLTLKGGMDTGSGQGISQTYMAIDCSGYKELGIAADVTLSERMVVKVNGDGRCNEADKRVTTSFSTVISDWNDILISVSLPPFMLVGLDGFVFEAQETVFDFSDTRNAANVRFPEGYEMEYMIPGSPNLWRGIYINTLTVTLPPQFARRSSASRRVSFSAQHLLLMRTGFRGGCRRAIFCLMKRGWQVSGPFLWRLFIWIIGKSFAGGRVYRGAGVAVVE